MFVSTCDFQAEDLKKECAQMKTLTKSQEQALAKKENMMHENEDEIKDLRKLQETMFNLSKVRSNSAGAYRLYISISQLRDQMSIPALVMSWPM